MKILKTKVRASICCFMAAAFILTISGCGKKTEPKDEEEEEVQDSFVLTAQEARNKGLVWGKPKVELVPVYAHATGVIDLPPQYVARLSAKLGGHIRQLFGLPGDHMHKGDVLAEIENLAWVDWQQAFLEGHAKLQYLEKEEARQRNLMQEDAGVKKQWELTLSELNGLKASQSGLKTKLQYLQMDTDQLIKSQKMQTIFKLKAPFDGFIKAMYGFIGKKVGEEEVIVEMLDPSHLHLELKVFEFQSAQISTGQTIWFQVPSRDTSWHKAEVFLVGKNIDMETSSLNIHGHIEDEKPSWLPGSFVQAKIVTKLEPRLTFDEAAQWKLGNQTMGYKVVAQADGKLEFKQAVIADTSGIWLTAGVKALESGK